MSEEYQIPFNNRTHDRLTELEKKINTQAEKIKGFQFTTNRFLKKNLERIEKLEKILLLPDNDDWISGMRRKYNNLEKKLSELKQCVEAYRTYQNNCSYTNNIKEVLWNHFQEHLNLGIMQKDGCTGDDLLEYWDDSLKEGLKKLDGDPKEIHIDVDTNIVQKLGSHALVETCLICDGTGINLHVEKDEIGIRKFVEYPCQCQKDGEIKSTDSTYLLVKCPKCNHKWQVKKGDKN